MAIYSPTRWVGADNGSFEIDMATGQLRTTTELDKETHNSYSVSVTATDSSGSGNSTATVSVTVEVEDVDEAPDITVPADCCTVEEDATEVGTFTAEDPEGAAVRWSKSGRDSDKFELSAAGVLTFESAPDFETPGDANRDNEYEVTVSASDATGHTGSESVTVKVTNVEEDGTITLSSRQPRVGIAFTATLSDPDVIEGDVDWEWFPNTSSTCTSTTAIENADTNTYTPKPEDAENNSYLCVKASYTDGSGAETTEMSSVNQVALDISNKAPKFEDQDKDTDGDQTDLERKVDEGVAKGTVIGNTIAAVDPNVADKLTYTLGGPDAASFALDLVDVDDNAACTQNCAQLQTKAYLDSDEGRQTYTVEVTANDSSDASATVVVTIKVNPVDEAPEIMLGGLAVTGLTSSNYAENGTDPVATYTASGPMAAAVRWSLTGDDAEDFTITGGMLAFRMSPDFEVPADADEDNVYNITVTANDGENTGERDVTVTVTDVDDEPDVPETLFKRYDADDSGDLDKGEVIDAILDYGSGLISKSDVVELILAYLFS